MQKHGDELNWHSHLHLLATDGAFDTQNPSDIVFHPCGFWDLSKMAEIFRFTLQAEEIGVELTEGFMMDPEASVSALVFHHPEATYFSV
ncbi:MAG TPA: vitamin B12 dependent-methionine synthase activation domain-containing protein [Bdellovibrionota bacterium]|nr:vitamin B12 dependent-methionine synthase activation domain-containing protein [Bdellovibrionota bacterium]